MDMNELTQLSEEDLKKRLVNAQRELLTWQENVMTGKEMNHAKLQFLRQDVARIKTVLHTSK